METEKKITLSAAEADMILEKHGVRPSPVRSLVYRALTASDRPVSVQDIEYALITVDRSSVTRSMASFVKAGLVHTISDGSGTVKYELCRGEHHHTETDEHLHFRCENCGRTLCLHDIPIPAINLPAGFSMKSATFVISGLCDKCQSVVSIDE